jgi:hypothetical protein
LTGTSSSFADLAIQVTQLKKKSQSLRGFIREQLSLHKDANLSKEGGKKKGGAA